MIDLEDNVGDIVGKAQRGLGIADSELVKKAGISADQLRKIRDGEFDEATLRAIAPTLNLDANALVDLAAGKWKPEKLENFDGLAQFSSSCGGMLVKRRSLVELTLEASTRRSRVAHRPRGG